MQMDRTEAQGPGWVCSRSSGSRGSGGAAEEKAGEVSLDLEGIGCQDEGLGPDPVGTGDWESGRWATGIFEGHVGLL